jgi:hypothetical protein
MKRLTRRYAAMATGAALMLTLAACKQPEGAMPVPTGEQPNKLEDISRDLQNLASRDANAPMELSDDLASMDPVRRPAESITELSRRLATALGGATLSDADAKRVANQLFVVLSAQELSGSQIEQLGTDLQTMLTGVGADAQAAAAVSTTAKELASSITRNRKRWYHR